MGRIAEKNPRYRTKQVMARDLAQVLSAPLSYGSKFAVIADILWCWSEFEGKINGCIHWSKAAKSVTDHEKLRHEHVVPKKHIIDLLMKVSKPSEDYIFALMTKHCIGAVVTLDEDKRLTDLGYRSSMPENWNGEDVWARYKEARIEIDLPNQ